MNWVKYKLRFWRCNKSFLQTVFCTEFWKLCTFFWYQFKLQQKLSYPPNFQSKYFFFRIWQQRLHLTNLGLKTYLQQDLMEKNHVRFNAHAQSESFVKAGQLEEKCVHLVTRMAATMSGHTILLFFYQLLISGINM